VRRNSGGCCPVLALALALALTPVRGDDARISSAEIMTAALDIACVDYRIVGGCLWMTCTPLGCEFDYSIRAAHRIPEAVVTAYPFLGNSSWVESNALVTPTAWAEEGGASDEGGASVREQALKFKLADVIGSPGVIDAWTAAAASTTALPFCTPLTYPMTPYFISTLDPAWRDPIVETPLTLAHALDRVGKGAATFAGLYPRIGFVNQGHDYKSALTAAIRAMDIVRRDYQPHVYVPLAAYRAGGQGQWPPGPDDPVRYQQLTPTLRACTELPDIDDTLYLTDPYAGRLNQVTGNAWQVWRDYACCEPAGATLLYHF
jgi:integrating conjugative element protein (TIGR03756 family)